MADGGRTEVADPRPDGARGEKTTSEYSAQSAGPVGPPTTSLRLDVIVRSLQVRLGGDIDAAILAEEVEKEVAAYSSARVTRFVSILVESRVRERLCRQGFARNEQGSGLR